MGAGGGAGLVEEEARIPREGPSEEDEEGKGLEEEDCWLDE